MTIWIEFAFAPKELLSVFVWLILFTIGTLSWKAVVPVIEINEGLLPLFVMAELRISLVFLSFSVRGPL